MEAKMNVFMQAMTTQMASMFAANAAEAAAAAAAVQVAEPISTPQRLPRPATPAPMRPAHEAPPAPRGSRARIAATPGAHSVLPPRELNPEEGGRVRGTRRASNRVDVMRRTHVDSGNLALDDHGRVASLLHSTQVGLPPTSPLSPLLFEDEGLSRSASPEMFQSLRDAGMAKQALGDAAASAVVSMFRLQAEKELKKAADFKSYSDFSAHFQKMNLLNRRGLSSDPDRYWAMKWVKDSVEYLTVTFNWPVARKYYQLVMDDWSKGFIDPTTHSESDACLMGDVKGALHQVNFLLAHGEFHAHGSSKSSGKSSKGTKTRQQASDTKCDHHNLFYPKFLDHSWDAKTKTGTCNFAASVVAGK